jgi:hypothetical protein
MWVYLHILVEEGHEVALGTGNTGINGACKTLVRGEGNELNLRVLALDKLN